jgi:hypothetical protein
MSVIYSKLQWREFASCEYARMSEMHIDLVENWHKDERLKKQVKSRCRRIDEPAALQQCQGQCWIWIWITSTFNY